MNAIFDLNFKASEFDKTVGKLTLLLTTGRMFLKDGSSCEVTIDDTGAIIYSIMTVSSMVTLAEHKTLFYDIGHRSPLDIVDHLDVTISDHFIVDVTVTSLRKLSPTRAKLLRGIIFTILRAQETRNISVCKQLLTSETFQGM
jgi:hypothetical protein